MVYGKPACYCCWPVFYTCLIYSDNKKRNITPARPVYLGLECSAAKRYDHPVCPAVEYIEADGGLVIIQNAAYNTKANAAAINVFGIASAIKGLE